MVVDNSASGRRPVRSFVLRGGRLTEGQQRALDQLWPLFGLDDDSGLLELPAVFGNSHPVIADIGFGNGESTWQMAQAAPRTNFLGVEVHPPGVGHLLLKLEEHGLQNVRIAQADAVEFLQRRVADNALAGVRLYFPDPWPKKRHHKRRIVQTPFLDLLASKTHTGAIVHMATDWTPYAEHMQELLNAHPAFENQAGDGAYSPRPEWRPQTKYELWG
ncbi:MAG TPA: tRNA (guanosine(46)-N7)-methyltransferase TrmB [Xanthomonadales bacterium]|nr:tRNA (guanosine(46)-N7)-methyltransferase TrmB [Xanthomonadales bacterium]